METVIIHFSGHQIWITGMKTGLTIYFRAVYKTQRLSLHIVILTARIKSNAVMDQIFKIMMVIWISKYQITPLFLGLMILTVSILKELMEFDKEEWVMIEF